MRLFHVNHNSKRYKYSWKYSVHQDWALKGFTTTHCILHKSTLNTTLCTIHFASECICAFVYILLHSLKLLHSNFRHLCAWKRSFRKYSTSIKSVWKDVLGLSENSALVGYKTRLKWITLNANANHICYRACRGLWNTCEDSCYDWSYPSKNTSLLQHVWTATQFCAILRDRPRVRARYLH